MDDTEVIIEEGEITDDSDDNEINDIVSYKVLERPPELLKIHKPPVISNTVSEDETEESSDSDSDDVSSNKPKRTKLRKLPVLKPVTKPKKYDIWSRRAQEDSLAETLISCDVSKIDRSLGVESYDYRKSNRYRDQARLKRKHGEQKNVHLRLGKREKSEDKKGTPRAILDLIENLESSIEDLAKDIANKLFEEKDDLILRVVKSLGKEKSIELFKKTQNIEQEGGMLIMNGTRRRTPGGVYIFSLKKDDQVTTEQQSEIFLEERVAIKQQKKLRNKQKMKNMKNKIKGNEEKLKDLPTRMELTMNKEKSTEPVINPPPSPASEDSSALQNTSDRSVNNYSDEFLDVTVGTDMDLF